MKLNRRILLVTIGVLFISLFTSSVFNIRNFRANYTDALISGSYGLGQSLNSVIGEMLDLGLPLESLAGMDKKVKQLVEGNPHISYAGIADLSGRALFHSDSAQVGRIFADEVMQKSTAAVAPLTQHYHRFDGSEYFDFSVPIFDSGKKHIGVIRLGFPTEVVDQKVRDAIIHVALNITLSFLVIALLINALLARLVSRPVIDLSDQARNIAAGRFDTGTQLDRSDEIGVLSGSLNAMAATIKSQMGALQLSRDDLERQVAARTSELGLANSALQEKNRALVETIALREQIEAELLRSNAELEQFSYSVSHDMRQPLRMISSYMQLLERNLGDRLDPQSQEFFNIAIGAARRMDEMMLGLLDYSRIGNNGEPHVWIESSTVLAETMLFLQPVVAESHAEILIDGVWPRALVRRDEMQRLLQNLIGNALKFRIAGHPPKVAISSEVIGPAWRVSVADNGIGISTDQLGKLFKVFQRLRSHSDYEGTGIGLALCRKIAVHHGGKIWVTSPGEGLGSCFHLEIPLPVEETGETQAGLGLLQNIQSLIPK